MVVVFADWLSRQEKNNPTHLTQHDQTYSKKNNENEREALIIKKNITPTNAEDKSFIYL